MTARRNEQVLLLSLLSRSLLLYVANMDLGDVRSEDENGFDEELLQRRPLPHDLPKSLDDRQPVREYGVETEMYDAWQGTV